MRLKRTVQSNRLDRFADHEIRCKLKAMSDWLYANPEMLGWIASDLCRADVNATGRKGLPVEILLRCAILKQVPPAQLRGLGALSGELPVLSSHCQATPRFSAEEVGVTEGGRDSSIGDVSWERINRLMLTEAKE